MKTLPDKSIDLFLCDLPYGCLTNKRGTKDVGWGHEGEKKKIENLPGCEWDIKIDLEQFWIQVERLMKDEHTPIIHFCNTRFGYELIKSKEKWFRYDLVWNKMRGVSFLSANKQPLRSHENIYVFAKKGATYYRKDVEGKPYFKKSKEHTCEQYKVQRVEGDNKGTRCVLSVIDNYNTAGHNGGKHPTQKPDDLYAWLIERYSKEGDTILDPTAGSFTSVFTAEKLKRNGIGIEKDETFFKKAEAKNNE
jgi:site-specific DNA-methyltransferase (adenine-specific)